MPFGFLKTSAVAYLFESSLINGGRLRCARKPGKKSETGQAGEGAPLCPEEANCPRGVTTFAVKLNTKAQTIYFFRIRPATLAVLMMSRGGLFRKVRLGKSVFLPPYRRFPR